MKILNCLSSIILVALVFSSTVVLGSPGHQWQLQRLLYPDDRLLASERDRVFIYDGLYSYQVDDAMDNQFDRIDNMMFLRVKVIQDGVETLLDDDCD